MKKTLSMVLAALMLAGTAVTATAADEEINLAEIGTVITGPMSGVAGSPEDVFDGDISTWFDYGVDGGEEYWVGLQLPVAVDLTHIRLAAPDTDNDGVANRVHAIYGTIIEGSNDGVNWEYIMEMGDQYDEYMTYNDDVTNGISNYYEEYTLESTSYTYFRVWNDIRGIAIWGEIELHGILLGELPKEYIQGDLNGDDSVDILDAVLLFQHSMVPDLYPLEYPDSVDFNVDDCIDIADAVLLFQHSMVPDLYPLG